MRVLVVSEPQEHSVAWAQHLKELDHIPLEVPHTDLDSKEWFAALRSQAARADVFLMGIGARQPGWFMWLLGYAEALGTQVILVSEWRDGVLDANPRNVRYATFQDAVDMYFSTGRAMTGERALP